VLQRYVGKKEEKEVAKNAPLISRKIKAFKLKKLSPWKDNLLQITLVMRKNNLLNFFEE